MSAETALRAAVLAALAGEPTLTAELNGVFEERPVRASPPHALLAESIAADWSAKGLRGREVRLAITLIDLATTPERIGRLAAAAEAAIEAMAPVLPGWRIVSTLYLRGRIAREGADGWRAEREYRFRMTDTKG